MPKQNDNVEFLDLRNMEIVSKEELDSLLEKLQDFRLKSDKGDYTNELNGQLKDRTLYEFKSPIPESMQSINLKDLKQIDIDWKMMTKCRPLPHEDEFYSRLVELERLESKTIKSEEQSSAMRKKKIVNKDCDANYKEFEQEVQDYESFARATAIDEKTPDELELTQCQIKDPVAQKNKRVMKKKNSVLLKRKTKKFVKKSKICQKRNMKSSTSKQTKVTFQKNPQSISTPT